MSCARHARFACLLILPAVFAPPAFAGPPAQSYLSFSADKLEYAVGETALLSWASTNTMFCQASGDWSGKLESAGFYRTPPLDGSKTYSLKCNAPGGGVERTLKVAVVTASIPDPKPTLSFTASDSNVPSGGSTVLSWKATEADGCAASGGWSGARSTSGTESVGPLSADASFTLSCTGAGGSVSRSVSIDVASAPPVVSLTAATSSIDSGASTTLSWSAENATSCSASGGWSGSKPLSGSESVSPTTDTTYTLSCTGNGGSDSTSVTVAVDAPAPTLSFTAADASVVGGGSTTLSWTATDADSCQASGGWSGTKSASGAEAVGPISQGTTYSLSCTGSGGSVVEMLSISAIGEVAITWQAPTQNTDGSTLTDLVGYRIRYGQISGTYTHVAEVTDPTASSQMLSLASGTYYVVMTAVNSEGKESGYSNEISQTVL